MDHCRVLRASINRVPATWKRHRGHRRHTWIWTVEDELRRQHWSTHWMASSTEPIWLENIC